MLYEKIKLETGETIIAIIRKHWWVIFTRALFLVLLALMPLFVVGFFVQSGMFGTLFAGVGVGEIVPHLTFWYAAWLLVLWMALFNFWTDHYLDLWTVTTRRVIAIDQRGLFRRFISSFRLERLQDMNIEVNGIIPTFLNFGTIEAQTAGGSNEEFRTHNMPDPRGIKAMIIKAADDRQHETGMAPLKTDGTL